MLTYTTAEIYWDNRNSLAGLLASCICDREEQILLMFGTSLAYETTELGKGGKTGPLYVIVAARAIISNETMPLILPLVV